MKTPSKILALGLAAALLLPTGALAADVSARQTDLDYLYETLKTNHPNLFAVTSEADFLSRKAEIEASIADGDDFTFAMELQSLVALAGDSHTSLSFSAAGENLHYLPAIPDYLEGKWVLTQSVKENQGLLGHEIVAVNGLTMDEVLERFAPLTSADNDVRLRRQTEQMFYVAEILDYLDIAKLGEPVVLTLKEGSGKEETLSVSALTTEELGAVEMVSLKGLRKTAPATEYDKKQLYFALPLDESTYYIQYNRCQEDPEQSMEDFTAGVEADLSAGAYTKVLLDLRNNGGGSDGVISPLLMALRVRMEEDGLRLYGLIGEATYSSAVINAAMVKEMGGILAGSPSGGSVDHFGSVRSFSLPGSGLKGGHSSKFIDMETLLVTMAGLGVEPLVPEFAVEQSLSDFLDGTDTLVKALLERGDKFVSTTTPSLLTRGAFVEDLWRQAGAPKAEQEVPFEDLFPLASYVPALRWAAETGLVQGDGQGRFRPTDALTEDERALILQRLDRT